MSDLTTLLDPRPERAPSGALLCCWIHSLVIRQNRCPGTYTYRDANRKPQQTVACDMALLRQQSIRADCLYQLAPAIGFAHHKSCWKNHGRQVGHE